MTDLNIYHIIQITPETDPLRRPETRDYYYDASRGNILAQVSSNSITYKGWFGTPTNRKEYRLKVRDFMDLNYKGANEKLRGIQLLASL
jgi:hypothetical protein